jgi:hypothetical protein
MWTVKPDMSDDGKTVALIIHLDTIVRASHPASSPSPTGEGKIHD